MPFAPPERENSQSSHPYTCACVGRGENGGGPCSHCPRQCCAWFYFVTFLPLCWVRVPHRPARRRTASCRLFPGRAARATYLKSGAVGQRYRRALAEAAELMSGVDSLRSLGPRPLTIADNQPWQAAAVAACEPTFASASDGKSMKLKQSKSVTPVYNLFTIAWSCIVISANSTVIHGGTL